MNDNLFLAEKTKLIEDFNTAYEKEIKEINKLYTVFRHDYSKNILFIRKIFFTIFITAVTLNLFFKLVPWIVIVGIAIALFIWHSQILDKTSKPENNRLNSLEEKIIFDYISKNIFSIKKENITDDYNEANEAAEEAIDKSKLYGENTSASVYNSVYTGSYRNIDYEFYEAIIDIEDKESKKTEKVFSGIVYNIKLNNKLKNISFTKHSSTTELPKELIELLHTCEPEKDLKHRFDEKGNLFICLEADNVLFGYADIDEDPEDCNAQEDTNVLLETLLIHVLFLKKVIDIFLNENTNN